MKLPLRIQIFNDHFSQTQLYDNNTESPRLDSFPSDKRISFNFGVIFGGIIPSAKCKCVESLWSRWHWKKNIQMCAKGLYESFTDFMNLTFLSGQLPQSWKLANVIPLFKKGDRPNYRPISQTTLTFKNCRKSSVYSFIQFFL